MITYLAKADFKGNPHPTPHVPSESHAIGEHARLVASIDAFVEQQMPSLDVDALGEFFLEIKKRILSFNPQSASLATQQDLHDRYAYLRQLYLTYYQAIEHRAAENFLTSDRPLEDFFLSANHDLVQADGVEAGLNSHSRVAFIGCGCWPWTAMEITRLYGASVTGIERDHALASLACRVIEKAGLSDAIQIKNGEGESCDFSEFSHVYLAGMCDAKKELITNIEKTDSNAVILVRSARSPFQVFYGQFFEEHIGSFSRTQRIQVPSAAELETLLFTRR